jgi:hypothetical protein
MNVNAAGFSQDANNYSLEVSRDTVHATPNVPLNSNREETQRIIN